jgi:putative hydrolase of HD superfamily
MTRLAQQLAFIIEVDKLKQVFRRTLLTDRTRLENDAEHSWHIALMAVLLSEYANEDVDLIRVVKMLLIHDIVEIDAGDTFCYDEAGHVDKLEREQAAADRLFNLLPDDQATELRELWDEFEERQSAEARFAAALDRLQPLLHNFHTDGEAWQKHGVRSSQVLERNRHMAEGAEKLWDFAEQMIHDAVKQGMLAE